MITFIKKLFAPKPEFVIEKVTNLRGSPKTGKVEHRFTAKYLYNKNYYPISNSARDNIEEAQADIDNYISNRVTKIGTEYIPYGPTINKN